MSDETPDTTGLREDERESLDKRIAADLWGYYLHFEPTGNPPVDRLLSAVGLAAKAYHHTEGWGDGLDHGFGPIPKGETCADFIQRADNAAARHVAAHPTPDASPDPAVVTPDAGDAPVLDELAALELAEEVWEDEPTDAEQELMQRVLASDWLANHVAAAREAARAEERERIAQAIEAEHRRVAFPNEWASGYRSGLVRASGIARHTPEVP